jgi:hypothetical protein
MHLCSAFVSQFGAFHEGSECLAEICCYERPMSVYLAPLWRINGLVTLIGDVFRSEGSASDGGLECDADGLVEAVR